MEPIRPRLCMPSPTHRSCVSCASGWLGAGSSWTLRSVPSHAGRGHVPFRSSMTRCPGCSRREPSGVVPHVIESDTPCGAVVSAVGWASCWVARQGEEKWKRGPMGRALSSWNRELWEWVWSTKRQLSDPDERQDASGTGGLAHGELPLGCLCACHVAETQSRAGGWQVPAWDGSITASGRPVGAALQPALSIKQGSLNRSVGSPESAAGVDGLLEREPT